MKRSLWYWLLGSALVAGVGYWLLMRALTPSSAAAKVERGKMIEAVSGTVTVEAVSESVIESPDDGVMKNSRLKEGQVVKAGEVLAGLDPLNLPYLQKTQQIALDDANRQMNTTLASEYHAQSLEKQLDDARQLKEKGYYPQSDYDKLVLDTKEAEATAKEDRADLVTKLKGAQNDLNSTLEAYKNLNMTAPYDGVITAVYAYNGDVLSKGKNVAKIISRECKIIAQVNQDDVAAVRHSKTATIRFFAYHDNTYPARVKLLIPSSESATQSFTVMLELEKPTDDLIAGLTGEVSFTAGEHDNTLLIPRRALFGNNVIVVKDGRAEVRNVDVGYLSLTTAEILSGLTEGELVLTEDLDQFRDGERVHVTTIGPQKAKTP
jgi:RND family efflux transporter MFP subunit